MKKGFIFSMDAFLAIILFVFVIFMIYIFSLSMPELNQQYFFSEDFLTVLSEVRINEINLDNYPKINNLIINKKINDTDVFLAEQVVTFQLNNDKESANLIIEGLLSKLESENLKTAVYIGENTIYGNDPEDVNNILSRTRLAIGKK